MRIVFQAFVVVLFVLFSPMVFVVLAFRMAAPSSDILKAQLIKKDVYSSAISELHKQIDATITDASRDDPMYIIGPFIKKEFTPGYIQKKAETLIDDIQAWVKNNGREPVLSFKDLKDKLMSKNRNIIIQLENAVEEIGAQQPYADTEYSEGQAVNGGQQLPFSPDDISKFLKSDFTLPMGAYIGWMKVLATSLNIVWIVLSVFYAFSILLIVLLAPGWQSKMRWLGWTLLLTALWNIPGVLLSTGSAFMIAKTFTQSMTGAQYIIPFIETFLTSIVVSYAKVTSGVLVMLFIFSIGILIVSLFAKPAEISVAAVKSPKKGKK